MPSRFSGEVLRSVLTTRADRKTGASSAGQVIIYGGSGAGRRRAGGQGAPERLAGLGITEAGAEWLVRVAGTRLLAGLRLLFLDRLGRHQHGHAFDVGVADLHREFSWLNRGRRVTQRDRGTEAPILLRLAERANRRADVVRPDDFVPEDHEAPDDVAEIVRVADHLALDDLAREREAGAVAEHHVLSRAGRRLREQVARLVEGEAIDLAHLAIAHDRHAVAGQRRDAQVALLDGRDARGR